MSWNKNTLNHSQVNRTIELLDELGIPYTLEAIGEVKAIGLNDMMSYIHTYWMRRLSYNDKVILEHILRSWDCDVDDIICSEKFDVAHEPQDWKLEEYIDVVEEEEQCPD
jgi:hypothetical protein